MTHSPNWDSDTLGSKVTHIGVINNTLVCSPPLQCVDDSMCDTPKCAVCLQVFLHVIALLYFCEADTRSQKPDTLD